jgi:hypothetical protein
MARFVALLACALALLATSMASAAIVEHSFSVINLPSLFYLFIFTCSFENLGSVE